jgi:hypothetical protein
VRWFATGVLCVLPALVACPPSAPVANCQSTVDCPSGYRCNQASHLCLVDRDAASVDATVAEAGHDAQLDATAPDRGVADQVTERSPPDGTLDRSAPTDAAGSDARDSGEHDGGAREVGVTDGPGVFCSTWSCPPPRQCLADGDGGQICACPGLECNGTCFPNAQCCLVDDCHSANASCNSHRCVFTETWQQGVAGYTGAESTFINSWAADMAYPGTGELWVREDVRVGLIRFEVGSIPTQAVVTSAQLMLYEVSSTNGCWTDVSLFPVIRPWDPSTATWNLASTGKPWTVAGCNGVGTDRDGTGTDPPVRLDTSLQWYTFDVTAAVQDWVARSHVNAGLAIRPMNWMCSVQHNLASTAYREMDLRPRLRVVYLLP